MEPQQQQQQQRPNPAVIPAPSVVPPVMMVNMCGAVLQLLVKVKLKNGSSFFLICY